MEILPLDSVGAGGAPARSQWLTVREDSTKSAGEKSHGGIYFFHRRRICGKLRARLRGAVRPNAGGRSFRKISRAGGVCRQHFETAKNTFGGRMLALLNISNFALISELKVEFDRGLNLLTGETGSGKSIIVDALGVLIGDRFSPELIRAGERHARSRVCSRSARTRRSRRYSKRPASARARAATWSWSSAASFRPRGAAASSSTTVWRRSRCSATFGRCSWTSTGRDAADALRPRDAPRTARRLRRPRRQARRSRRALPALVCAQPRAGIAQARRVGEVSHDGRAALSGERA